MIKNIIYAILLGVGMAACLSQREEDIGGEADQAATAASTETELTEEMATPDPASFIIQKGRVGELAIGTPIDSMRNQVPVGYTIADTTLTQEGNQSTAYLLKPEGAAKGLLIEQGCNPTCNVWRINVQHPDFRTPKGIGVGSKYSEVQEQHPISTVTLADGGFVAVSNGAGMSFVLDTSQLPQNRIASYTPETVPANTIVKRILIY
ncbi:mechanosensitive ion channel protein MscS [uncultured Pontibacter sp.]|uniref:mechanosensitive ion channel protein MscS n=1 Tax=uncultured Pontibacter sp. TaxID=453356 RepID=UPI00262ED977|nr:mechanosensitive ion channel protein MscS [uncultured Pontibacter sp.]